MNTLYDALFAPHTLNEAPFLLTDDGATVSFAAFVKRAAQMAHVLCHAGVRPGDRVLVQAPKTVDMLALYAGCVQAGAVFLPLNTAYTLAEVAYFVGDAAPAMIVCDVKDVAAIEASVIGKDIAVLSIGADVSGSLTAKAHVADTVFQTCHRGPNDLAGLLYTSGTTGRSKGAMMSHRNLLSNARTLTELWRITDNDHLIHALPIFHTHGLFVAMNTALIAGAAVRFMARFDLDDVLDAMPDATLMMGVPTFYTRLLADPRFTTQSTQNMRLFISGSAPLLAETHAAFHDRTGHKILERYGMTETNMITSNPYDGGRVPGTVGYALPGIEVQVTRDGVSVSAGDIGMIEVRGDNVFQGYWGMPEKTKEELRDSGFFITGDLGVMDTEGRVTIVGRQKDLIISGGYNVYPKEVEDVLNAVDGVLESAVFGVPDPDLGERVIAALVPTGASLDEAAVRESTTLAVAKFKNPKRYVVMDALPRNTMGKVQKTVLRKAYANDV